MTSISVPKERCRCIMMATQEEIVKLVTVHTRAVDPDLKKRFKSYCAGKRMSMQATVIALMEFAINEDLEFGLGKDFDGNGGG